MPKQCINCKQTKAHSEFYSRKTKFGTIWYTARCKICHLKYCKEHRHSEHGKKVYRAWTLSKKGKIAIEKRMKTWREKNKAKRKAQSAISNAIRDNRLKRQPCRICQNPNGEAHHLSYDDPYNVDWLCKTCHFKAHYG